MLIHHIRHGEKLGIHRVFWAGEYSVMGIAGSIETFLFHFLQGLPDSVSLVIPFCDGLMFHSEARAILKDAPRPIMGLLTTRFHITEDPILLLPLDDDIFSRGLLPVLSGIPRLAWEERIARVFWRGRTSGGYPSVRTRTVEALAGSDHNVRLLDSPWNQGLPIPAEHFGEASGLDVHFRYKYILILDGNQIASNHMWVFGSGAVPIMITHPCNEYWFKRFIVPMVHYVPVAYDLSDLDKKIGWLQDHDFEARNIMENAMHLAATVFSAEFQQQYLRDEVQRIVRQFYTVSPETISEMVLIPIGMQCTNATFKERVNKKSASLPFDWMLSTPRFVYQMLELLLEKKMDIRTLVVEHFFACEKRAAQITLKREYYYTTENGGALYNMKYNVIFPHDTYSEDTIEKYVRRFERLKDLIFHSRQPLCFVYTSPPSTTDGNFLIDDALVIHDVYFHLSNVYTLLNRHHSNFKLVVFDALQQENRSLLDGNILFYPLAHCTIWDDLLPQMENHYYSTLAT